MDEQRTDQRVLGSAQQGHFAIRTFEDFPVLDTTGGARIFRGADQAGHKMEMI